jgi:hypothetical protein
VSNAQADALRIDMLGGYDEHTCYAILKPSMISPRQLKRLNVGVLLAQTDPYHLRIVQGTTLIARAKLGRVGSREALHIVSTRPEPFPHTKDEEEHLVEVRLCTLPKDSIVQGEVIECDAPVLQTMLLLVDGIPVAMGEGVEYDNEPMIRIVRLFE